jgi:hypothetical protein
VIRPQHSRRGAPARPGGGALIAGRGGGARVGAGRNQPAIPGRALRKLCDRRVRDQGGVCVTLSALPAEL